jgi:MoxR-like ATPase
VSVDEDPVARPAGPRRPGPGRPAPAVPVAADPTVAALTVAVAAKVPVLLWGAPGTGKTSAIRALAAAAGLPASRVCQNFGRISRLEIATLRKLG